MAMSADTRKKAEQIARMLWQGYRRSRVAQMMGMSYVGLLRITKTPEFLEIDEQVRTQVLGLMDETLARRTDISGPSAREELNEEMEDAIPEAWRVLIQNVRHKQNLKAALEVLDRDPQGQFAKYHARGAGQQQPPQVVGVGVNVQIDSKALAQAVEEAKRTHEVIDRANKLAVKPAEA